MISDAQIAMLRLLSKDVAIAVDRAVKSKMQEQRISQGQLLLQTTRLMCSLQSQEQIVEAACQCACELLRADSAALVDCSGLSRDLYEPVNIGGAATRRQVFEAIVWQKVQSDDSSQVASEGQGTYSHDDSDGTHITSSNSFFPHNMTTVVQVNAATTTTSTRNQTLLSNILDSLCLMLSRSFDLFSTAHLHLRHLCTMLGMRQSSHITSRP